MTSGVDEESSSDYVGNPAGGRSLNQVQRIICQELRPGYCAAARQVYRDVIARFADADTESLVLGCTKIESLIDAADSPVPIFPTIDCTSGRPRHGSG